MQLVLSNLGLPRQIYEVNTVGGFHETIAKKLKLARSSVSRYLSDVHSQILNLRRDVDRGIDQMEKCIDAQ
jgi:predicted transcriptional regulator